MNTCYLLIGSNIGDSFAHLELAMLHIQKRIGLIGQVSSVYKTEPWGNKEQQEFLNQVLEVNTELEPDQLLKTILEIEHEMGRNRQQKWEPRIIDIDILFFGNRVVHSESLQIPHPLLQERRFTLLPLAEIAPDLIHPVLHKKVRTLLEECRDTGKVLIYSP